MHGAVPGKPRDQHPYTQTEGLSPCELRVLRYLPDEFVPGREIATELSVVAEHRQQRTSAASTPSSVPTIAPRRSAVARELRLLSAVRT